MPPCVHIINQAFSNACGDVTARFCALDREGHCFIALDTQQNILRLWQKMIARQQLSLDEAPASASVPGTVSGDAPQAAPVQPDFAGKDAAA